jgi:hypothetical protein
MEEWERKPQSVWTKEDKKGYDIDDSLGINTKAGGAKLMESDSGRPVAFDAYEQMADYYAAAVDAKPITPITNVRR